MAPASSNTEIAALQSANRPSFIFRRQHSSAELNLVWAVRSAKCSSAERLLERARSEQGN